MTPAERAEERMLAILTGRTHPFPVRTSLVTNSPGGPAPDLATMVTGWRKLMADIPPPPFFASSRMLGADKAVSFKHEGLDYVGAHPDFWARIPVGTISPRDTNPFARIKIVDLDADEKRKDEFWAAFRAVADKGFK